MKKLSTAMVVAFIAILLVVTAASALYFSNGNFETGDFSGWTQEFFLNNGLVGSTPYTGASIVRDVGGSDQSAIMGPYPARSQTDPYAAAIKYPAAGSYTARVNGDINGNISNTIKQTTTATASDVDGTDGLIHLRFIYAAIMENPGHTAADQPWFYVSVKNTTKGTTLYDKFSYVGDSNPWQLDATSGWNYLDWIMVDISGAGTIDIGDVLEFEAIAADCAQGGHAGYVYMDEIGSTLPAPAISGTGPLGVSGPGATIDYVFNYTTVAALTNVVATATLPTDVTYVSVSDATNCNQATGVVTCTFPTLAAGASGTFTISTTANVGATFPITLSTYGITATGSTASSGPAIVTYLAPTITNGATGGGVSPNVGPVAGGTVVVITGTNLGGFTSVTFDGLPGVSCTVNPAGTAITCTTPAHAAGPVDVVVTTAPGGLTATSTGGFTYVVTPPPSISTIVPNYGPTTGGTTVVITGTDLVGGTFTFGGIAATCTVAADNLSATCTTPAHAEGAVDVVVTTAFGTHTFVGGFTYYPPATITEIFPDAGPVVGGTEVVIIGTNFIPGTKVYFGGVEATCTIDSPTQLTCVTPAHAAGAVDVAVTTMGGTATFPAGFTYYEKMAVFYSDGLLDGWIKESKSGSKEGGQLSALQNIPVGDDYKNRQIRSVLSFATNNKKTLPANAVIGHVFVRIKQAAIVGGNPFLTLGVLNVDIKKGSFGLTPKLESRDFTSRATSNKIGTFNKALSGTGWYTMAFTAKGKTYINRLGLTQLRLYFTTPSDKDNRTDYFRYYPGDTRIVKANKPQLIIYYTLP